MISLIRKKQQSGFTLIEMIVSLGLFSVVITMSMGALLVLLSNNLKLQGEQNIMTNLTFAVDSMTRELRTGTGYNCQSSGSPTGVFGTSGGHEGLLLTTQDCLSASILAYRGVSFIEGGSSITGTADRILYFYDRAEETLKRRVGDAAPLTMVSSAIRIMDVKFWVTGTTSLNPGGTDTQQPTVTIYLEAEEISNPGKVYYIHTTVTQRVLDL